MDHDIQRAICRIEKMEYCFDTVQAALRRGLPAELPLLQALLRRLADYQQSGRWLHDYQLDEQGLLPPQLKRGVLSQDALYDLLRSVHTGGGRRARK